MIYIFQHIDIPRYVLTDNKKGIIIQRNWDELLR